MPIRTRTAGPRLAVLAVAALLTSPAGAATLLGPPTYLTTNLLDINRGSATPPEHVERRSSGHNGSGSTGAASQAARISPGAQLPTEASGQVNATTLRSFARATGELFGSTPGVPNVTAQNTSSITRFWEFASTQGAATVDLDFLYFLEGTLQTAAFAELVLPQAYSRVRLALDVVNPAGSILGRIFEVSAFNTRQLDGSYSLVTTSSGAADPADWRAAIADITLPTGIGRQYEVNYFGRFANAYAAPVGVPVGLRWTLETEAHAAGSFAFNIHLESAFRDTAEVGFDLTPGQAGASFAEILSVPEPGAALLLAVGLCAWAARRSGYTRRR